MSSIYPQNTSRSDITLLTLHWWSSDLLQHLQLTDQDFKQAVNALSRHFERLLEQVSVSTTTIVPEKISSNSSPNNSFKNNFSHQFPHRVCLLSLSNTSEDLLIRCACLSLGWSTVTINWQADSSDEILYKFQCTKPKIIYFDDMTNIGNQIVNEVLIKLPQYQLNVSLIKRSELPKLLNLDHTLVDTNILNCDGINPQQEAVIVFSSGTTSKPKGARLSVRVQTMSPLSSMSSPDLYFVLVNPLHHVNSTTMSFWSIWESSLSNLYFKNAKTDTIANTINLHLIEKYSTSYWTILMQIVENAEITKQETGRQYKVIVPLVARHLDYLHNLVKSNAVNRDQIRAILGRPSVAFLMGSSPIGQQVITTFQSLFGFFKMPVIRFGSTETSLQVMGTPLSLSNCPELMLHYLQLGWNHSWDNEPCKGFFIGYDHKPFCEVAVMRSIDPDDKQKYMYECDEGEPGLILCRTQGAMICYCNSTAYPFVKDKSLNSTDGKSSDFWYTGLGDRGFYLITEIPEPGRRLFYWISRSCDVIIRGGANYSAVALAEKISHLLCVHFGLQSEQIEVAVLGLYLSNGHESNLGAIVQKKTTGISNSEIEQFLEKDVSLPKYCRPDVFLITSIPRTFKGTVDLPSCQTMLENYYKAHISIDSKK